MFGSPAAPTPEPPNCGLCGGTKLAKSYTAQGKFSAVNRTVELCQRCDLAPDPPVTIHRGAD